MRAVIYDHVGPAREVLKLVELPDPHPGAGEVRVKVMRSGVNPSDVKSRGGYRGPSMPYPQVTPHRDGAGVIDEIGGGVSPARLGERVWIWNAAWGRPWGTAAEYIVLPAAQAVTLPSNTSFDAGACFGIPALTALYAVIMDGGVKGKNVLIAGGAGAVSHYAIQFAKQEGAACVLTTVSSDSKASLARAAGADVVINYKTEPVVDRVQAACGLVDRVIELDLAANLATDIAVLKPDHDIVVYGSGKTEIGIPFGPSISKNIRYRFFMVYHLARADRDLVEEKLTQALKANKLQHNLGPHFALSEIAAAHEAVESGQILGNVLVDVA